MSAVFRVGTNKEIFLGLYQLDRVQKKHFFSLRYRYKRRKMMKKLEAAPTYCAADQPIRHYRPRHRLKLRYIMALILIFTSALSVVTMSGFSSPWYSANGFTIKTGDRSGELRIDRLNGQTEPPYLELILHEYEKAYIDGPFFRDFKKTVIEDETSYCVWYTDNYDHYFIMEQSKPWIAVERNYGMGDNCTILPIGVQIGEHSGLYFSGYSGTKLYGLDDIWHNYIMDYGDYIMFFDSNMDKGFIEEVIRSVVAENIYKTD